MILSLFLMVVILVAIDDCYCGGNRDHYFGSDWRSLFQPRLAIIILAMIGDHWPKASPIHTDSQNCSLEVAANILCVRKRKLTRFDSPRMVNQTLHVMFDGLLSLVQTKRLRHICVTLRVRIHIRFIRVDKALLIAQRHRYICRSTIVYKHHTTHRSTIVCAERP